MDKNQISKALQRVVVSQSASLVRMSLDMPDSCAQLVQYMAGKLQGRVIFSGIGKSGYIARKIAAGFASTGTPAIFIHPAEASHGDLGMISKDDLLIALSNSGSTAELRDIVEYGKKIGCKIASITSKKESWLAKNSDFVLTLPQHAEASSIGAPSNSTTLMLCLGDALMIALHEAKGVKNDIFKSLHPGGALGEKHSTLEKIMHPVSEIAKINLQAAVKDIVLSLLEHGGRYVLVMDAQDHIAGIITSEAFKKSGSSGRQTAKNLMQKIPAIFPPIASISDCAEVMNRKKCEVAGVANRDNVIMGMIHINDIKKYA